MQFEDNALHVTRQSFQFYSALHVVSQSDQFESFLGFAFRVLRPKLPCLHFGGMDLNVITWNTHLIFKRSENILKKNQEPSRTEKLILLFDSQFLCEKKSFVFTIVQAILIFSLIYFLLKFSECCKEHTTKNGDWSAKLITFKAKEMKLRGYCSTLHKKVTQIGFQIINAHYNLDPTKEFEDPLHSAEEKIKHYQHDLQR